MAAFVVTLALTPWLHPLTFGALPGWQTGKSGNARSVYVGRANYLSAPLESAAWIARHVRYLDDPTADPPNETLSRLSPRSVIVWAVIYSDPEASTRTVSLDLSRARAFPDCCEAERVPGGMWEITGSGGRGYSVIIRVYFGARPTTSLRSQAQRALNRLDLPPPH